MGPFVVEETIRPGLRYTEETSRTARSLPVRDCSFWLDGVDESICGMNVVSFTQRFGAISVPAEGIGGVETLPAYRRQGHIRSLMEKVIHSIGKRVAVVFVSEAIEGMYEKFGYINCLADASLTVQVHNVERHQNQALVDPAWRIRRFSAQDLPAMVQLYNQVHAERPWTHVRHPGWNRLEETQTWNPGSEVILLERDGNLAGYAVLKEAHFGRHAGEPMVVDELAARDTAAAHGLLRELAARCWQLRLPDFQVREPLDSPVGVAAQEAGCAYQQVFHHSGGMMGMILDRQRLLALLEPELLRRLDDPGLRRSHEAAFDALLRGAIIPDNRDLLRLLVGYGPVANLRLSEGELQHESILNRWFPGGGTRLLPMPYSHYLDRY